MIAFSRLPKASPDQMNRVPAHTSKKNVSKSHLQKRDSAPTPLNEIRRRNKAQGTNPGYEDVQTAQGIGDANHELASVWLSASRTRRGANGNSATCEINCSTLTIKADMISKMIRKMQETAASGSIAASGRERGENCLICTKKPAPFRPSKEGPRKNQAVGSPAARLAVFFRTAARAHLSTAFGPSWISAQPSCACSPCVKTWTITPRF